MADRTIKVSPLPQSVNEQKITSIFSTFQVTRVKKMKEEAFVQFQSAADLEAIDFAFEDGMIPELGGAKFDLVDEGFRWDFSGSESSSVNDLTQQKEEDQQKGEKTEQIVIDLSEPDANCLVTIAECDSKVMKTMKSSEIRSQVFKEFTSINRLLKKNNSVIVEFLNLEELEKLQSIFPSLKVAALGENAFVDLLANNSQNFTNLWNEQQRKEGSGIKEIYESQIGQIKQESESTEHFLHDNILPKLDKVTSMEANFSQNNEKLEEKKETTEPIHEEENDDHETKVKIESNFLLQTEEEIKQRQQRQRQETERRIAEQEVMKRQEERLAEEKIREEKMREEEREKQEKQRQQKEREILRQREREQRLQRQQQERKKEEERKKQELRRQEEEEEERARKEDYERKEKERAKQEEQRVRKEEQERKERERIQRQKEEEEKTIKLMKEQEEKKKESEKEAQRIVKKKQDPQLETESNQSSGFSSNNSSVISEGPKNISMIFWVLILIGLGLIIAW